jgi:hypothetical protein
VATLNVMRPPRFGQSSRVTGATTRPEQRPRRVRKSRTHRFVFDETLPAYPLGDEEETDDDDLAPWLRRLPKDERMAAIGYPSKRPAERRRGAGAEARRQERRRQHELGGPRGLLPRTPERGRVAG